MTMSSNAGFGEDVPKPVAVDPQSKRRRSRRRAWRDGLCEQTVVANFEDVRAYRAFERVLIGSADPRSVIELELVHRLASLLWRLRRAGAIETGLFELRANFCPRAAGPVPRTPSAGDPHHAGQWPPQRPRLERTRRSAGERPRKAVDVRCTRRAYDGRTPAASPNVSCAFPILTQPCLVAWVPMKRDYGARPHKPFGPSTRCDNRRLQCGNDCAIRPRFLPGIGRGNLPVDPEFSALSAATTMVASAAVHCVNQWKHASNSFVQEHVRPRQRGLPDPRVSSSESVNASKKRVGTSAEVALAYHRIRR